MVIGALGGEGGGGAAGQQLADGRWREVGAGRLLFQERLDRLCVRRVGAHLELAVVAA